MDEFSKDPLFKETDSRSVISELALALTAFKDDVWRPSGTAVVIAPYLAITAKHVITDYWGSYDRQPMMEVQNTGSFQICAAQFLEESETSLFWSVPRLWLSPVTDVAFLALSPGSEEAAAHAWRTVRMDLSPPAVGERISAFGYHSSSANLQVDEHEKEVTVYWDDSPTTTVGEVIEVHHHSRDSVMLPFPCFRINSRSKPGMSGGPVFNDSGQLCGLICTGLDLPEEDGSYDYYAASLWAGMGTLLDMDREGFSSGVEYPALDLAKHGFIAALNWERVGVNISSSSVDVFLLPEGNVSD